MPGVLAFIIGKQPPGLLETPIRSCQCMLVQAATDLLHQELYLFDRQDVLSRLHRSVLLNVNETYEEVRFG